MVTVVFLLYKKGNNPDDLNLIIEQAIEKVLQTNQNTNNYYKNLSKHKNCSECSTPITTENYKKNRSVCKNCYNTNTLNLRKKRFGLLKEIVQVINIFQIYKIVQIKKMFQINRLDLGNKIVQINKLDLGNRTLLAKKKSFNKLKNVDPDCLMEKFIELYNSKYVSNEEAQVAREHGKEILNELLRAKAITKRHSNTLYKSVMSN